jgi:hypothetical protein
VTGPSITINEIEYPDTLLIIDLRAGGLHAYDATSGAYLKTFSAGVAVRGLRWESAERLLVAAGSDGVRVYDSDISFVETLVSRDVVNGPHTSWDVLPRPDRDDYLVADPVHDAVFQFDSDGTRVGVFARPPGARFVSQLARGPSGSVFVADTYADAIYEYDADGLLLRTIAALRPRGIQLLATGELLVAGEEGVRRFDLAAGQYVGAEAPGFPENAPRMLATLGFAGAPQRGDLNGDGVIDGFDIEPFVLALTDPAGFAMQHPLVPRFCAADANGDGAVDGFDIEPFIAILTGREPQR